MENNLRTKSIYAPEQDTTKRLVTKHMKSTMNIKWIMNLTYD